MMQELAQRAGEALTKKWTDPSIASESCASASPSMALSCCPRWSAQITPAVYEVNRNANWMPRLQTALKYYQSLDELLDAAQTYNHKIVSLRWLEERQMSMTLPLMSITTFLLESGVFVHNSIDGIRLPQCAIVWLLTL